VGEGFSRGFSPSFSRGVLPASCRVRAKKSSGPAAASAEIAGAAAGVRSNAFIVYLILANRGVPPGFRGRRRSARCRCAAWPPPTRGRSTQCSGRSCASRLPPGPSTARPCRVSEALVLRARTPPTLRRDRRPPQRPHRPVNRRRPGGRSSVPEIMTTYGAAFSFVKILFAERAVVLGSDNQRASGAVSDPASAEMARSTSRVPPGR
jgi:hypothetical protein